MSQPDAPLLSRSAFKDITLAVHSAGVVAAPRDELVLLSITARKNRRAELAQLIRGRLGLELPQGPLRNSRGPIAIIGTGPETWLVTCEAYEGGVEHFAPALANILADVASVTDQSDGYGVLRFTGSRAHEALSAHLPVDLHLRVFAVGAVATTAAAYIDLIVWRLDDDSNRTPVFELAVPRSLVSAFCQGF